MKLTIFVFFILVNFFYCDFLSTSTNMTQVNSTKSSFSCNSINFILCIWRLKILIAIFTYFALMAKMSIIYKDRRLISLRFNIFVQDKWSVCMYFKRLLNHTLFMLYFRVHLKIFIFLRLLLDFNSMRSSVAELWWFKRNGLLIKISMKSSGRFLPGLINFNFRVVFTWWKSFPKVHFIFFFFI